MVSFTTVSSTHACTQNVEFSVAKNANFNSGSPVTTTGYVTVWLDATTLAAGDVLEIRTYKAVAGGTLTADDVATIQTAQIWTRTLGLVEGNWDITVKLTSATGRTIGFEVTIDTNDVNAATISNGAIGTATFVDAALTAAKFATDAIGASAIAAAAVTKLQSGLALATDVTTILGRLPAALVGGRMSADVGSWLGTAPAAPTVAGIPKVEDATMQARIDATRAAKIDQLDAAVTSRATAADVASAIAASVAAIAGAAAGAVWSTVSEGTETVLQVVRLLRARAAGKRTVRDGDGAYAWRDAADTKDRIAMTRAGSAVTVTTADGA